MKILPFLGRSATAAVVSLSAVGAHAAVTDLVANGSFEQSASSITSNYCYENASGPPGCPSAVPSWGGDFVLIRSSNSGFGSTSPTPYGDTFIGLQNDRLATQTINFTTPGQYTVSWSDAGRVGSGNEAYSVFIGNALVGNGLTTSGQDWTTRSYVYSTTLGSGVQTLKFQGLNTAGDNTAFIDNVSITSISAVPEPASWALMAAGLLATAAFARKRRG